LAGTKSRNTGGEGGEKRVLRVLRVTVKGVFDKGGKTVSQRVGQ